MSPEQHEQQEAIERWPIGRRILERIRGEINVVGGPVPGEEGEDVFRSLYLTERFGCIPDHLLGEMAEELQGWYEQAAARVRPPAPAPPEGWPEGKGFVVTLNTERVIHVAAEDRNEALERALAWRSNEDDPELQLGYEEATRADGAPINVSDSGEEVGLRQRRWGNAAA